MIDPTGAAPSRRAVMASALAVPMAPRAFAAAPLRPRPYGATPSPRQLAWQRREVVGFVHFTVNTFTDREWGLGDEDPAVFNPTDFDADQIVDAFKGGGIGQIVLTAKHHDGFCLWPSPLTEHSVKNSPFRNGKGDVVGELAAACARHGVKFGLYLSPWDRNYSEYGRPAYVEYYHRQWRDLLTNYGELAEIWFDGANGGEGYYGGACETRHIDARTYYGWPEIYRLVREHQPQAVMFADADADVRWVGNEDGVAGDPCWPTMGRAPYTPRLGNAGVRGGPLWNPAEADTSIRPSWFWHADEDEQVRSPAKLLRTYLSSAGRGANLMLNAPANRRGRIADQDVAALRGFRAILDQTYGRNLNQGAVATASSRFGPGFEPETLLRGDGAWAAREDDRAGAWLQFDWPAPVTFDLIRLREAIEFGARVDTFAIEAWTDGGWRRIARKTCIGSQRLIRLDQPATAQKVRVRILSAAASPVLAEFGLYRLPELIDDPVISRDDRGRVTIVAPGDNLEIRYRLASEPPQAEARLYTGAFDLWRGGVVHATAVRPMTKARSATVMASFDIVKSDWRIVSADGENAQALLDRRPTWDGDTFIGAHGQATEVVIDMGQVHDVAGIALSRGQWLPYGAGPPESCEVWITDGLGAWGEPTLTAALDAMAGCRAWIKAPFAAPARGRYLRLRLSRAAGGKSKIGLFRVSVIPA
jgi:alpha-L-fucosidase